MYMHICMNDILLIAAGAMRLPGTGEPKWEGPSHFMTDFYATKFELPLIPFVNSSPNGYYKFYGEPAIKAIGKCTASHYCEIVYI